MGFWKYLLIILAGLAAAIALAVSQPWQHSSFDDLKPSSVTADPQPVAPVPAVPQPAPQKPPVQTLPPDIQLNNVPFTTQAPTGNWADPRQENGCEEAAAVMAMAWVKGEKLSPASAELAIVTIADFELKTYGSFFDTSTQDTVERIFVGYFGFSNATVVKNITIFDIKKQLAAGNLVIVPVNGRKLNNPHYKNGGPLTHMLVITGYNDKTGEFITNDSGTHVGLGYRYPYAVIEGAMYDYTTGLHEPQPGQKTAMIVVRK